MKREQKAGAGVIGSGAVLAEVERVADSIVDAASGGNSRKRMVGAVLLRVEEAAAMLGLSKSQVYAMCQRGELPAVKIGKAVRIPVEELQAWIRANVVRGVA